MVSDEMIRQVTAQTFVQPEPCLHIFWPAVALPLDAVHVHDAATASQPIKNRESRSVVPEDEWEAIVFQRMQRGKQVEHHGAKGAIPWRPDGHEADAIPKIWLLLPVGLAINVDLPAVAN